jgi:hypothetical protein
MQALSDLLQPKTLSKLTTGATTTGINKLNPVVSNYKTTDLVVAEVSDLMNAEYHAWYCKMAHLIGRERFLILASIARADGNNGGSRLFSYLLRKELCGEL